jgi:hypothetical protein
VPSTSVLAASAACVAFALLAIVGPGLALQRALRVRIDPALVLPLGVLQAAAFQWLALLAGWPGLFTALCLLMDLSLLVSRTPWLRAPGPSLRGCVPALLAAVLLLAATRCSVNRATPDGGFVFDGLSQDDTAFHAGLTFEAMHHPPQVPGLAGVPLHYHLGSALVRAAAVRSTGVLPYELLTRAQPLLFVLALMLALRGMARELGGSSLVVRLVPFTVLAGDFSFLFALDPMVRYWTDYLRGNLLLSVVLGDDVVIALAMALASLVALARHEAGEGRSWLWLAGLVALGLPFFKVFVAAHLLLGVGVAFTLSRGRWALLALALPLSSGLALLVAGGGADTVTLVLDPLVATGVIPAWLSGFPVALQAGVWVVLWVGASLGLRLFAIPEAIRALRTGRPSAVILAAMALSGWIIGLLFRMSPRDLLPGQKVFNEMGRFIEQSGALLWIFTAIVVASWMAKSRRRALVLGACAALSLASTAQFVVRKQQRPLIAAPAGVLQAMAALARVSQPGEVVLQRPDPRFPPPPMVFAGLRVPYTRSLPYLTQFASRPVLEDRLATVKSFFRTEDPQEALLLARSLDARYLCLYGEDRVAFDPRSVLVPLYETPETRVYRILR